MYEQLEDSHVEISQSTFALMGEGTTPEERERSPYEDGAIRL